MVVRAQLVPLLLRSRWLWLPLAALNLWAAQAVIRALDPIPTLLLVAALLAFLLAQPVAWFDFSGVWTVDTREDAEQSGFPRTVEAQHHDLAALINCQVDGGADFERSVRFRQVVSKQWGFSTRRRSGETNCCHPFLADLFVQVGHQFLGAGLHLVGSGCF